MNRDDFQRISRLRVREAKALLDKAFYSGAYYLLGYAVECALKACIAKQTKKHDFPDKNTVRESYTHDLEKLLRVAGLATFLDDEMKNNSQFKINWTIVKDWKEDSRYNYRIDEKIVRDFYSAVTARKNGVLTWLKKYW